MAHHMSHSNGHTYEDISDSIILVETDDSISDDECKSTQVVSIDSIDSIDLTTTSDESLNKSLATRIGRHFINADKSSDNFGTNSRLLLNYFDYEDSVRESRMVLNQLIDQITHEYKYRTQPINIMNQSKGLKYKDISDSIILDETDDSISDIDCGPTQVIDLSTTSDESFNKSLAIDCSDGRDDHYIIADKSFNSFESSDDNISYPAFEEKSTQKSAPHKRKGPDFRKEFHFIEDKDLDVLTRSARSDETKRIKHLINRLKNSGLEAKSLETDVHIDAEDTNNFIQHKNDEFNCLDNSGRVLVNVGHSIHKDKPIYLAPQITKSVMSHQIGGIRFLYDNLIESITNFDIEKGFGCILSHSMGLGKTLQIIALVDIFLRETSAQTVLIIMPVNVLNNWIFEFNKWLPEKDRHFGVFSVDKLSVKARNNEISLWHNSGGVLLMGYEKYQRMTSNCAKIVENPDDYCKSEIRDTKRLLSALVDPGPHMIICDEGHRIKNDETGISKALKKIKTRRRVILTGYPLQNKLKEYYCMVDFVRPNYLGLKWEFRNTFETPITNGQCRDSTEYDKQLMRERSHVLNQLLKGFIQRRNEDVLKPKLREKHEFVVLCKLTEKQREIMNHFLNVTLANDLPASPSKKGNISLFRTFVVCSKICNHPDIIYNILERGYDEELDPEADEQLFSYSWAKELFENYDTQEMSHSSKMVVLFEIIEETIARGERLLIFSQWLFTLDLIELFLKWQNKSYYRLDGQTKADEREELIQNFNSDDNKSVHIFLISTKAGGVGINLTGANRVIIFDACWNPCHDAQAACRIYRMGQSKPCFIYRLINENSMEKRIFNKQIFKQGMSRGVVDQKNIDQKLTQKEVRAMLFELRKELQQIKDTNLDQRELSQLKDPLLLGVCEKYSSCLTSVPSELETYLEENKELALTSAQKEQAFVSFQVAEQLNQNQRPNTNVDQLADILKNTTFY